MKRIVIGFLALCFGMTIQGCAKPEVSKSNFDNIQNGMSVKEVEAILGPGREPSITLVDMLGDGKTSETTVWKEWPDPARGEHFYYYVAFDKAKVVTKSEFTMQLKE